MTYATQTAISRANAIGLNLSLEDWRAIFLAITDEIAGETTVENVSASLVSGVRDSGERWHVNAHGREFDVIYDRLVARIVLVIRPRDPDDQPAVLPKPAPPLKGKAAERILETAQ